MLERFISCKAAEVTGLASIFFGAESTSQKASHQIGDWHRVHLRQMEFLSSSRPPILAKHPYELKRKQVMVPRPDGRFLCRRNR
jgi:hypothetical protein